MIYCEVPLILTWSENFVLTDIKTQRERTTKPSINASISAIFKITGTKLYFPVVTLSTENDKTLLKQLRKNY